MIVSCNSLRNVGWLCWGLTSQSTIFQSCRDGAIASWVINQYFRGVKCLAQGHNTAAVGLEPRTSRSESDTLPLSHRAPPLRNGLMYFICVYVYICMWYCTSRWDSDTLLNYNWALSSEFVSSSIPSWQILTAHAQPFRGARDLVFCVKVPLDSLLVWASSGGSGEAQARLNLRCSHRR